MSAVMKRGHAKSARLAASRNPRKPVRQGQHTDRTTAEIVRLLVKLEAEARRIEKLGARQLNGPHFKTGTAKMFFLAPAVDGQREHVYVGVDVERQAEMLSQQRRFAVLQQLRARILALQVNLDELNRQRNDVLFEAKHYLTSATRDVRELVKPRERYEVTPGSSSRRARVTHDESQAELEL